MTLYLTMTVIDSSLLFRVRVLQVDLSPLLSSTQEWHVHCHVPSMWEHNWNPTLGRVDKKAKAETPERKPLLFSRTYAWGVPLSVLDWHALMTQFHQIQFSAWGWLKTSVSVGKSPIIPFLDLSLLPADGMSHVQSSYSSTCLVNITLS